MTEPQVEALAKLATHPAGDVGWAIGHPRRGLISRRTAEALAALGYMRLHENGRRVYITDAGRVAYTEAMGR